MAINKKQPSRQTIINRHFYELQYIFADVTRINQLITELSALEIVKWRGW